LLGLISAELELKPLAQAVRGLLDAILKAWHLRFAAHNVDKID
jgi:hypothetical protein